MPFRDRFDAARQLAQKLSRYNGKDGVVLAIPRGGLQIGIVVAKQLRMPLDIVLTKKIGYPGNDEYAIGAVSLESFVVEPHPEVSRDYINEKVKQIREKLKKRYEQYVGKRRPYEVKGKIAIIVDDGIATGRTMSLTVDIVRKQSPSKIVVAIPVGPPDAVKELNKKADEVVCLSTPAFFDAIGAFYENFEQVEDEEAIRLLKEANK